ncbi:MAG: helix-turn-helix domain-containing protein [Bacteroidales bacterium]|nr:helix-turn-helix domain-containing protein [Bacteroidales bacterium]
MDNYLSPKEVAGILRFNEKTICRWCCSGKLPAYRFGRSWRIDREFVKNFEYKKLKD